jgi:hypothetical protein
MPFVTYRARTSRRLQEFARCSGTDVHDRLRPAVKREKPTPIFRGRLRCAVNASCLRRSRTFTLHAARRRDRRVTRAAPGRAPHRPR